MGWDTYLTSSTTEEVPRRRGRTQGPICFKLASKRGEGEKGRRGEGERGEGRGDSLILLYLM